jgi:hypothetical protein
MVLAKSHTGELLDPPQGKCVSIRHADVMDQYIDIAIDIVRTSAFPKKFPLPVIDEIHDSDY